MSWWVMYSTAWIDQYEFICLNGWLHVAFCPVGGTNLRTLLVGNGINVYRSLTRWTNCNGKQRCGTCIVEVRSYQLSSYYYPPFTSSITWCPLISSRTTCNLGAEWTEGLQSPRTRRGHGASWEPWQLSVVLCYLCVRWCHSGGAGDSRSRSVDEIV